MTKLQTWNALFDNSCSLYADNAAVGYAFEPKITYGQLKQKVVSLTSFLCEKEIKQGDRVAILAENSPNWGIAYFSIIRTGAVVVPILPDFLEQDDLWIIHFVIIVQIL